MTEKKGTLSAYAPPRASPRVPANFELPLQIYIIETVEREARSKQLFASLGHVAWDSAKAVPGLPSVAQEAGVLAVDAISSRLTFGAGLQTSY